MMEMGEWTILEYLQAGAYTAIMLAVLGVPQMLSSYFDHGARRSDRMESEASTERRHQERLLEEARREERQEERRREERTQDEERRRREAELLERRFEDSERRHQEMMAALITALNNGGSQRELIRTLQQTVETLETENARLRQQNGNGNSSHSP